MADVKKKQEIVDTLKGPRYYRISLNGYGGESAYMSISKEAYDFWHSTCKQHGDCDLVAYMINDEDEDIEYDNITDVPKQAQFLHNAEDDNYKSPWYEAHTEFEHTNGVELSSAYITVEEIESDEYSANHVADTVEGENLLDLLRELEKDSNFELDLTEMGCEDEAPEGTEYVAQIYSSEKGSFFEGLLETVGDFDLKKLKVYTTEYLNGEDIITSVEYNGEEVYNDGSETMGKGFSASVFKS